MISWYYALLICVGGGRGAGGGLLGGGGTGLGGGMGTGLGMFQTSSGMSVEGDAITVFGFIIISKHIMVRYK